MSGLIIPGRIPPSDPREIEARADSLRKWIEASGAFALVAVATIRSGRGSWTISGPPGIAPEGRKAFAAILHQAADYLAPPRVAPVSEHDWETI